MSRTSRRVNTKNVTARKTKVNAYYSKFRNGINRRNGDPFILTSKRNGDKRKLRSFANLCDKDDVRAENTHTATLRKVWV